MATNEELSALVGDFRQAEDALRELVESSDELHTASMALEATRENLEAALTAVANGGLALETSSMQLGTLAAQLASATEALEKTDPEGTLREIGRLGDQVERLRSRIDETNAEQRTRLETAEKATQDKLEKAADGIAELGRRVKSYSLVVIGLLSVIIVLIAVQITSS